MVIVNSNEDRYCKVIAYAYEQGAAMGGHLTRKIELGKIGIPFLRSQKEFGGFVELKRRTLI